MTSETRRPGSEPHVPSDGVATDHRPADGWVGPPDAGAPIATAVPPVAGYGDLPGPAEYASAPAVPPVAADGSGPAWLGAPAAARPAASSSSTLSTIAVVVGAVALGVALLPVVGAVGALIGLIALALGLLAVDAIDGNGHVIASGWGEVQSLDASGRASVYSSYVEFDADVSRAAEFDVRDLDVNNALFATWMLGEDTTVEA